MFNNYKAEQFNWWSKRENIVGEIRVTNFDCINSGFCDAKFLYKGKKDENVYLEYFCRGIGKFKNCETIKNLNTVI